MNNPVKNIALQHDFSHICEANFEQAALQAFQFQYQQNAVYKGFCDALKIDNNGISSITQIPFLPISFFKTHAIVTTPFTPEVVFESSGTTQTVNSKHLVKDVALYEASFNTAFKLFYGVPTDWCIIALLPSYLERNNSSLVMMADKLIAQTGHPQSGFYLNDLQKLQETLQLLEQQKQPTLLLGVTFALLDFAEQYPTKLLHTIVMETGGMKGRRQELVRQEVHHILCNCFNTKHIHSEYGMTELLSQAYSAGDGIFECPPWMKVLAREDDDPLSVSEAGHTAITGAVNIIDLANIYSCCFIATDDAVKLYPDKRFEILGRLDKSDIRGCSLLTL